MRPRSLSQRTVYDKLNRVVANDKNGATNQIEYDARGNVVLTKDPEGYCVQHAYDAQNRRIATVDDGRDCNGSGYLRTFQYAPVGVQRPLGRTDEQYFGPKSE